MTEMNPFLTKWAAEWEQHQYGAPTEIQSALYEMLQQGESTLAVSPTGTGKTVAYTLPLLEKITPEKELQWLVLAPSHELVMQITDTIRSFIQSANIHVLPIIGGANVKRQIEKLKKKPQIIVASPGRALELMEQKKIKMHAVKCITLDECDQLLISENKKMTLNIINRAVRDRQLVLVSATKPEQLDEFMRHTESKLTQVEMKKSTRGTQNIRHLYMEVENRDKATLLRRLTGIQDMRALVFVRDKPRMDILLEKLAYDGVRAAGIHSDIPKETRKKVLKAFKESKLNYLVVTDVAARGLDIPDLPYVIHYDLAQAEKEYTHRSGRTGRMGKNGTVITFTNQREIRTLKQFLKELGTTGKKVRFYKGELHEGEASKKSR